MSNGVKVIRALLVASTGLTAEVPAARVMAGILPEDITLPAISVTLVSGMDRNIPNPGSSRMVEDRVQVTVLAESYPSQYEITELVRKACADQLTESLAGVSAVAVHTLSRGPDFTDEESSIYMGSQDFSVRYLEAR